MTARFRSVFAGFSGFVAANPPARVMPAERPLASPVVPAGKPEASADARRPSRVG